MIKELIERFDAKRAELLVGFRTERPKDYADIVQRVVEAITIEDESDDLALDPKRITVINHGEWQGTYLFVIGKKGYQPYKYWFVKISYGSCSVCDTFDAIRESYDEVSEREANGYLTLALHIVQALKSMDGGEVGQAT